MTTSVDPLRGPDEVSSEILRAELESERVQFDIVITGNVAISAHQSIKIPEHVPVVILRDPPGALSTASVVAPTILLWDVPTTQIGPLQAWMPTCLERFGLRKRERESRGEIE